MVKKICIFTLMLLVIGSLCSFAQEEERKMISIDAGAGISMAFFDAEEFGAVGFIATLLSLRGIFFVDARFNITNSLSAGIELGVAAMSVEVEEESMYLDLPLRAIFRFGSPGLFAQAYAGYYLSVVGFQLSGLDFGGKVSFGGAYVEAGYVIGDISYIRVAVGYALNDLFGF